MTTDIGIEITTSVKGVKELQRKMVQIVRDLKGPPMLNAMRDATLIVQRSSKKNLQPWGKGGGVDTGRLRASLMPKVVVTTKAVTGFVGSNVEYAPFVELGTKPHFPPISALQVWADRHGVSVWAICKSIARHGTRPRRYLQRAVEDNRRRIYRLIGKTVGWIITKKEG